MKFRTTYHNPAPQFIAYNTGKEHPLKEINPPLTPAQMLRRLANGQPISASKPTSNFPINNKFFTEKFDVIDTALRLDKKLKAEELEKALKEREEAKKQHDEFLKWKEQQNVVNPPPVQNELQ